MRIPVATYRVQFNNDFRFTDATALVPQLHRLGVSHLYASPIFAARPGSSHGYDVVDPNRLNPELGSDDDFCALVHALKNRGMGLLVDIVPNHMAAGPENCWWMDVLENGPASPYASYFGVNWTASSNPQIFLPILGDPYGTVLERGELKITYEQSGFRLHYYQHRLPIAPVSYTRLLKPGSEPLLEMHEFCLVMESLERLPPRTVNEWETVERWPREKNAIKGRLWNLVQEHAPIREHIERNLAEINSDFDRLDQIIQEQAYRIAFWKVATERINYRRFFDVSDLVGVRVEDSVVFEAGHKFVLNLVEAGTVEGLRVDHIDGLADPLQYQKRLPVDRVYVIAEKILSGDEKLPDNWPIHGTTGYDFLGYVNSLFVEPSGFEKLTNRYASIQPGSFADFAYRQKMHVISTLFSGEMQDLGANLANLAEEDRKARDLSSRDMTQALIEVTARMPVYRTYSDSPEIRPQDREYIVQACSAARTAPQSINPLVYDFLERVLTLQSPNYLDFVGRWQQITGPIMAKGVEDSAMYIYNALISTNEVGGIHHPVSVSEMHAFLSDRMARWPNTMNASSTHDTKRSEDVRARINVLSEVPDEWNRLTTRWTRWLADARGGVDINEEYFLFQTLAGAWPLDASEAPAFRERMKQYVIKAAREARTYTSWIFPDERHESELQRFIDVLFDHERFQASFRPFVEKISFYGAINSLSQLLIKATAPGLPDFYRGTITWDFSLVDPDNRRPVEFAPLTDFSAKAKSFLPEWRDGRVKIFLTEKLLAYRQANAELFTRGEYISLQVSGKRAENVFAFARRLGDAWMIAIAPRFATQLSVVMRPPTGIRAWLDTSLKLPDGVPQRWRNVITGASMEMRDSELPLHRALDSFPVALLRPR